MIASLYCARCIAQLCHAETATAKCQVIVAKHYQLAGWQQLRRLMYDRCTQIKLCAYYFAHSGCQPPPTHPGAALPPTISQPKVMEVLPTSE
jgi:hypothetical protein